MPSDLFSHAMQTQANTPLRNATLCSAKAGSGGLVVPSEGHHIRFRFVCVSVIGLDETTFLFELQSKLLKWGLYRGLYWGLL